MAVRVKTKNKSKQEEFEEEEEEEYEESAPKGRGRAKDDDDDEDEDEDEDENDELLSGGWKTHHRNKAETSNYPNKLDLSPDPALVMFLDTEPLVSFKQHWIERKGKKSFYCLGKETCPLCAIGDGTKVQNVFNVVRLDEGDPVNLVLQTGVKLSDILEGKSQKTPLTRGYWALARTGTGGTTNFDVSRVKERDLHDDWDTEPLDEDQLKKLKTTKWEAKATVQINSRKDLLAIAKESTGDYDADDDE